MHSDGRLTFYATGVDASGPAPVKTVLVMILLEMPVYSWQSLSVLPQELVTFPGFQYRTGNSSFIDQIQHCPMRLAAMLQSKWVVETQPVQAEEETHWLFSRKAQADDIFLHRRHALNKIFYYATRKDYTNNSETVRLCTSYACKWKINFQRIFACIHLVFKESTLWRYPNYTKQFLPENPV